MPSFADDWNLILSEIRAGLEKVDPAEVGSLVDSILGAERVFLVAVGRVNLSLQAMAKRLSHLGISCHCVGDINEPAATPKDLLIAASGSGETVIPVAIARVAKKHGARIALIGSNPGSSLRSLADVFVRIPVRTKLNLPGELDSAQPLSSLFDQVLHLFGDAVAMEIIRRRQIDVHSLWKFHANLE